MKDPDKNDPDGTPKIFKFYPLFGFSAMAVFGACMGVGLAKDMNWLVFLGLGFALAVMAAMIVPYSVWYFRTLNKELKKNSGTERTPEKEKELLDAVNNSQDIAENQIANAVYHANGADSISELAMTAFGFDKESRQRLKKSPLREKLKVIATFAAIIITLFCMMIGVGFANAGLEHIGFPLMGVGGGGFALIIAIFFIITSVQKSRFKKTRASSESEIRPTEMLCTGIVEFCAVHSQNTTGSKKIIISNTLYQILVKQENSQNVLHFVCAKYYKKGDTVKFFQDIKNPRKCRLIESDY